MADDPFNTSQDSLPLATFQPFRKLRDPCVPGNYVKLSKMACDVVDTPEFQRLRNLKQLGCVEFVYPTGTLSGRQMCFEMHTNCYLKHVIGFTAHSS